MANKNKKMTQNSAKNAGTQAGADNQSAPTSRFEKIFYRYLAWFPVLVLPMLVVEMFKAGDYAIGGIIGVMHAILVEQQALKG